MNNIDKNSLDLGMMDALACGDSPLHRLDPRANFITTLMFIVTVISFDKYTISALVPFLIYPVVLIALGSLPAGYLFKKLLVVSPLALLVGIFNPLMDRGVILSIGSLGISGGWVSFCSILFRFTLTVTAALVLVSLTGFNAVCESLLKFGVPRPFVLQLFFFYRYIFVLTDEAERMVRAWSLRSFHARPMHLKTFVSVVGYLLLRTLERAERIYLAMRCRGFTGHIHMIKPMKITVREVVFVLGWSLLFIFLRHYNIAQVLGSVLTGGFS